MKQVWRRRVSSSSVLFSIKVAESFDGRQVWFYVSAEFCRHKNVNFFWMTSPIVGFGIPNSNPRRTVDILGLLNQNCLMRSTFACYVPAQPENFPFTAGPVSLQPFNQRFRTLSFAGCNLRHLRSSLATDFSSAYGKTNSAFCCTVHISPDTDSHREEKLAGFWEIWRPALPTSFIDRSTDNSISTSMLPIISWIYRKLTFFRRILKLESFRYVYQFFNDMFS